MLLIDRMVLMLIVLMVLTRPNSWKRFDIMLDCLCPTQINLMLTKYVALLMFQLPC